MKIFYRIKFILIKINIYIRYKKRKVIPVLKWIFFGKEITNFTYEIENQNEIIHMVKAMTNLEYEYLKKILNETDPNNNDFKLFLSNEYYKDFKLKNIFGRRLVWYLLVRVIKPKIVIESGVANNLGSALLIYALYKNQCEGDNSNQYIGLDILKPTKTYFNFSKKFSRYKFLQCDSLEFLKGLSEKGKTMYISDAKHEYDFELNEYKLIKEKMLDGSIIISDNNSGSISEFSKKHNKNLLYFKEAPKNTWYHGATTGVSFFY